MHAPMELISPPSNLGRSDSTSQGTFAQSTNQLWATISSEPIQNIISAVAQKIWRQNRIACEKNNLFSERDIQSELSYQLYRETTKNLDHGILGLKCPQAWNDVSFSLQSYVYKIIYYIALKCISCSQTVWNGIPMEEYRQHYLLLLEEKTQESEERSSFFQYYLDYFKPLSTYCLEQGLISPNAFFLFALFHFPHELSQQDWKYFLRFFPYSQPNAKHLFQNSAFIQLHSNEGHKFTHRIQFLSWLLFGSNYATKEEFRRSDQAIHFDTTIRQGKNNTRTKIYRYLLCLLLSSDIYSLQEVTPEWERLLYKALKLNSLSIIAWKERNGTLEDLYTIIFTSFSSFPEYQESNHLANYQYRSFIHKFTVLQASFHDYWEKTCLEIKKSVPSNTLTLTLS